MTNKVSAKAPPSSSDNSTLNRPKLKRLSQRVAEGDAIVKLTPRECGLASFFLMCWLLLFAGGITMDTTKFRCEISPDGARALAAEAKPGEALAVDTVCREKDFWVPGWLVSWPAAANGWKLAISWIVVLLFFLPLNLAVVSAAAGALGALGNRANLDDEQSRIVSRDDSNPIMSGLLRGLFVYLFFISGLLLFDDKPFSTPGPGQYVRLAGFISLISFLVNYRPNLFSTISDWAFERINTRKVRTGRDRADDDIRIRRTTSEINEIEVEVPMGGSEPNGGREIGLPSSHPDGSEEK